MAERDILRLWENPSFDPTFNWLISEDREQDNYYVRQTQSHRSYRQLVEKEWFESAKHLIFKEAQLDRSELFNWLEKSKTLAIPMIGVKGPVGYDGVYYGFEYYIHDARCKIQWWGDGPKEWKPIIDWYHDFVAWLQSELDK